MVRNKKLIIFLVIVGFIFLGFTREFFFVHFNTVLYNISHNENYEIPESFHFFYRFDYYTLYIAKWFITPSFIAVFFILQWILLKSVIPEKKVRTWLIYFYLILLLLSMLSFGTGYLFGYLKLGYRFSRLFFGILQSPVPVMFLLPVVILIGKFGKE
jgi:hypothetical protein